MSAADFRNWLEDTLALWSSDFLQNKTLSDWCNGEFTYNAEDYADWKPFFDDIYAKFGIDPIIPPE